MVSDAPRPIVVTSLVVCDTPWNPATIGIAPSASASAIRLGLMSMMRARPCVASVITPAWDPVKERASRPRVAIAMASSAIEIRSPGGQQHVELASGRQRADLAGQVHELVGRVAHRGHDHHDPVAGLAGGHDPLRDPLDAVRVSDRRTTVLLHNECHGRAAPPRVVDGRLILSERAGVPRSRHGLVLSSATSRLACATTACSARSAAPPWVPQWLK